jgi:hypothetical protein
LWETLSPSKKPSLPTSLTISFNLF